MQLHTQLSQITMQETFRVSLNVQPGKFNLGMPNGVVGLGVVFVVGVCLDAAEPAVNAQPLRIEVALAIDSVPGCIHLNYY